MPHYNGIVDGASPPGYPSKDPQGFERKLTSDLPSGVGLVAILWDLDPNDWEASVTLEGDRTARDFLVNDLRARNVTQIAKGKVLASPKKQRNATGP